MLVPLILAIALFGAVVTPLGLATLFPGADLPLRYGLAFAVGAGVPIFIGARAWWSLSRRKTRPMLTHLAVLLLALLFTVTPFLAMEKWAQRAPHDYAQSGLTLLEATVGDVPHVSDTLRELTALPGGRDPVLGTITSSTSTSSTSRLAM